MAVVVIAFNGTRVDSSDTNTNWGNFRSAGGAPASEAQLAYQGTAVNKKITSTTQRQGIDYDPGASALNMWQPANRLWFLKGIASDSFDLNATWGAEAALGSTNADFHSYNVAGSGSNRAVYDVYPPQGGYLITAIDPRIAAWRDTPTGTPDLTAVDWFGWACQFATGLAKNENVALDAIDVGTGLTLTRGDSTDPDGTYDFFVVADEGTNSATAPARVGVVTSPGPGLVFSHGILTIGESATATVFNDAVTNLVFFPDGYHSPGAVGVVYNLGNASTTITDSVAALGGGSKTTIDTRPDLRTLGTSGSATLDGKSITNHRRILLNNAVSAVGATVKDSGQIDPTNGDYGGFQTLDGTGDWIRTQTAGSFSHTFTNPEVTIVCWVAPSDWTPGTRTYIVDWRETAGEALRLSILTGGTVELEIRDSADTASTRQSTAMTSIVPDGFGCWIKVEYDDSTGNANFFYSLADEHASPQDIVWVAHGSPTGTVKAIATINGPIFIGANVSGASPITGDISYVSMWDGLITDELQIFKADWRTGPDFTGAPGTRADGVAAITWEEQGDPVYTLGDNNTTAADLDGTVVDSSTSYAALKWDVNADPNGELDNMTFIANSNHAIEFGANTPATVTLTNCTFTGFNAANGNADSTFYNNTGGALTITHTGTTGNVSYRNGVGASTTVTATVTLTVTARDAAGVGVGLARVRIENASTGAQISQGTANASGVYTDGTYNYGGDVAVRVIVRKSSTGTRYIPAVATGTITSTGLSVNVTLIEDSIA